MEAHLASLRAYIARGGPAPAPGAADAGLPPPTHTAYSRPAFGTDAGADVAAELGEADNVAVARAVGLPLCEALVAYRRGRFAAAADGLLAARPRLQAIGGSHAQRDVFEQTLVDACMRAGTAAAEEEAAGTAPAGGGGGERGAREWLQLARALLAERVSERPNSPSSWHWYGASLLACSRLPDAGQHGVGDEGETPLQEATREAGESALLRARTLGLGQGGVRAH